MITNLHQLPLVKHPYLIGYGPRAMRDDDHGLGSPALPGLRYEIDKGLAGREPGSAPEFVAACHVYSPTLGTFQEALGPHRAEIAADVANYTDIAPIVQISEIVGG